MPKKKSEKESKEKKPTGKKPSPKADKAKSVLEKIPAVAAPEDKPKAVKTKAPSTKKPPKETLISNEDIALRAYFIAERRQKMGWHGDSTSDWVEAERQIRAEAAKKR